MPLTPDVAPGTSLMPSWGNAIRDRTVQRFANATELNAWAATDGAMAYTADQGELWERQGSAWRSPYAHGRRVFASPPPGTADYTLTATDQAVHSVMASVPLTVTSRRSLTVRGSVLAGSSTLNTRIAGIVRLGPAPITAASPTVAYGRQVVATTTGGIPGSLILVAVQDIILDPGLYYVGFWATATVSWNVYTSEVMPQLVVRDEGPG